MLFYPQTLCAILSFLSTKRANLQNRIRALYLPESQARILRSNLFQSKLGHKFSINRKKLYPSLTFCATSNVILELLHVLFSEASSRIIIDCLNSPDIPQTQAQAYPFSLYKKNRRRPTVQPPRLLYTSLYGDASRLGPWPQRVSLALAQYRQMHKYTGGPFQHSKATLLIDLTFNCSSRQIRSTA